jgi:hypothetical protein
MLNLLFGKRPNKNTIRKAAEHLMAIYGATTTLEVKKYLRAQGYIAFQYYISSKMDVICAECNWHYEFNGTFRIYFIPQTQTRAQSEAVPSFSDN